MASKPSLPKNLYSSNTTHVPNILERISATIATGLDTGLNKAQVETFMTDETRLCRTCGLRKPLIEFVVQKASKSKYTNECKSCHRDNDVKIYNPMRMLFGGKQIRCKKPRLNICQFCGKTYSENGRQMSRHHYARDPSNPLKFTIEACNSCHAKVPRENSKC